MRGVGVLGLALGLGCAVACGGRLERSVGRAGSPASSSGGLSGSAAVPSGGVASADGGVGSGEGGVASVDGGASGEGGDAGSPGLDPCATQFNDYGDYRSQVMAEFSTFGCKVDGDCLSFYDQSACDTSCVLLTTGARRGVIDRLNNFETTYCSQECSPQPWIMCPAPFTGHCVSGSCQ